MSTDPRDQTTRTQRTTTTTTRSGSRGTTTRRRTVSRPAGNSQLLLGLGVLAIVALLLFLFVPPLFRWLGIGARSSVADVPAGTEQRPTISFGAQSNGQSGQSTSQPTQDVTIDLGPPPSGPSPTFSGFYEQRGGVRILGLPISNEITVNGRQIQWFERARLEYWPENQGTGYEVQLGRLGTEILQGRPFQKPAPFVSQPGLFYFPETGYAVGEPFLSFWSQNGGLNTFGYPISSAVPEQLSDGQVHTVQYFERVRLEFHPEDPGNDIQLGLLGRALFAQNRMPNTVATPHIIAAPGPTNVPMP